MKGQKIMGYLAEFISKHHKAICIVGLGLFILSIISAGNITTRTQIKDMLPSNNPQVASFERITGQFSGGSSVIITLEGKSKTGMASAAESFVRKVKDNKKAMKYIRTIDLKVDRDFITKWGLLMQKAKDLKDTQAMFSKLNLLPFITSLNNSFEKAYTGDEAEEQLETNKQENDAVGMLNKLEIFFTMLRQYLKESNPADAGGHAHKLAETFLYGDVYSYAPDNLMLMFSIYPKFSSLEIEKCDLLMREIRQIRKEVADEFPNLNVGYAGDIGMQSDENQAMNFDMFIPPLLAFILVILITVFSYKQLRFRVFTILSLLVGVVLNYGVVGVTIKEITILTSVLAALLIGVGDDYGTQIVINFSAFLDEGLNPKEALKETFVKAGMGTFLAAVTAAIGFFVLAATGQKAFTQFGFVAGIGVLCCYLVMTIILPAMLIWFSPKIHKKTKVPQINFSFLSSTARFISNWKWPVMIVSIAVTLILSISMFRLNFEYDMMKLEPLNTVSVKTFYKIMDKFGLVTTSAMAPCNDLKEARKLTEQLEKESMIAEVHSIAQFIPPPGEQEARLKEIAKINNMGPRYRDTTYTSEDVRKLADEIQRLEYNVIEIGDLSVAGLGEGNKIVKKRNEMIHEVCGAETGKPGKEVFQQVIALLKDNPQLNAGKLTALDRYFTKEMDRIVSNMSNIKRGITLADLPENIINQFMDKDRKQNLVIALPKENIDSAGKLAKFNGRLSKISKKITGATMLMSEWEKEVLGGSKKAALYIFIFVFITVLITLRSFLASIIATIPLVFGMIWTFGLYPLVGLKLNLMNIAVIPLIIGLGINWSVYFVCRYLIEPDIPHVYGATGKAVTLSALTVMFGFGSIALLGSFKMISSIGEVLFMGITTTFLAAIFVQPALLMFLKENHNKIIQNPVNLGGNKK